MGSIWEKVKSLALVETNSPCSKLGIPSHLHTGSRQKNAVFDPSETIYRRFSASGNIEDWRKTNALSAAIFAVDNDSCNRSAYCQQPADVLYNTREQDNGKHYLNHGIIEFKVSAFADIFIPPAPPIKQNGQERKFVLHLEHIPIPCMYPHTEIWVFDGNNRIDDKPPKSTKALIRDRLLGIANVIKEPTLLAD